MSEQFYKQNVTKFTKEDERLSSKFNRISILRISSFIVALVGVIYFSDARNGMAITAISAAFVLSFGILVKWHNKVKYKRNHARFLRMLSEAEIERLQGKLSKFDSGSEFNDTDHAYANDLDVFGRNSVFQLVNRTTTITGRSMLASWLLAPADKQVIEERQKSVQELKGQPGFCQHVQATGMHHQNEKASFEPLAHWLAEPVRILNNRWLVLAGYILPVLALSVVTGVIWWGWPLGLLFVSILLNGSALRRVLQYALEVTKYTGKGVSTLQSIGDLLLEMEQHNFQSDRLKQLQSQLERSGASASKRIAQLAKILDFLNARGNMFYALFNLVFLVDIHLLIRAEKWKETNRKSVNAWFNTISEFEVLSSFAQMAYANPDYCFPTILAESETIEVVGIGHPLIKSTERIYNDFSTGNGKRIYVVTGSNMSGKSTFLRTIGVNVVLGLAGAPVCAKQCTLSKQQLFTSMRTQDNLEQHISSFYAELKRIEQLLKLLESSEEPVLFMLDEILKGTNSHDRHKGAVGLLKQLAKMDASGFISTHDLELGHAAEGLNYCKNLSFNSTVSNGKINFDYKLAEGICHSFNASALMRQIGIDVAD